MAAVMSESPPSRLYSLQQVLSETKPKNYLLDTTTTRLPDTSASSPTSVTISASTTQQIRAHKVTMSKTDVEAIE